MDPSNAVLAHTGTHQSEKAPWESWDDEMDMHFSPELAAAVAEYAERRYEDDQTSAQNKEVLAEQREISAEVSKQYQWLTPEEYADHWQRIGRVLSHAEFITILRDRVKLRCWYTQHPHNDKAVLHVIAREGAEPHIACWVQIGQMPELSIMRFDEHGVPLDERRRGWRTCLLQLILAGFIREEQANRVFGEPKYTEAYHRYNSTLQAFRNVGGRLE